MKEEIINEGEKKKYTRKGAKGKERAQSGGWR
jgi:hypothetical protein